MPRVLLDDDDLPVRLGVDARREVADAGVELDYLIAAAVAGERLAPERELLGVNAVDVALEPKAFLIFGVV